MSNSNRYEYLNSLIKSLYQDIDEAEGYFTTQRLNSADKSFITKPTKEYHALHSPTQETPDDYVYSLIARKKHPALSKYKKKYAVTYSEDMLRLPVVEYDQLVNDYGIQATAYRFRTPIAGYVPLEGDDEIYEQSKYNVPRNLDGTKIKKGEKVGYQPKVDVKGYPPPSRRPGVPSPPKKEEKELTAAERYMLASSWGNDEPSIDIKIIKEVFPNVPERWPGSLHAITGPPPSPGYTIYSQIKEDTPDLSIWHKINIFVSSLWT
jgi:hypothetical protein